MNVIPGAVVMGGLLGAAALEGFCNFCLGCVFFGLGIRFGLIPKHVYRIFTNTKMETVEGWKYENTPNTKVSSSSHRLPCPVQALMSLKQRERRDAVEQSLCSVESRNPSLVKRLKAKTDNTGLLLCIKSCSHFADGLRPA